MSTSNKPPIFLWLLRKVLDFLLVLQFLLLFQFFFFNPEGIDVQLLFLKAKATKPLQGVFVFIALAFLRFLLSIGMKEAIVVLISFFFSFIVAELGLRIIAPPIASQAKLKAWRIPDEERVWKLVPNLEGKGNLGVQLSFNSIGMRNSEISTQPLQNKTRVVALGDSFTFGYAVEEKDSFVRKMEFFKPEIEVLNGGVIGYNLYQSRVFYENILSRFKAKKVVYFFYLDDVVAPYTKEVAKLGYEDFLASHETKDQNKSSLYLVNLFKNLRTIAKSRLRSRFQANWLRTVENRKKTFHQKNFSVMRGEFDQSGFKDNLKKLKESCERNGARLYVVVIPDAVQLNESELQKNTEILSTMSDELKIPLLDLTPIFEKHSNPMDLYLFPYDAHTSPLGHQLIAQEVLKFVN